MPYRYLEDIAAADAAFEATGETLEDLFTACADALMNVMVENLESIRSKRSLEVSLDEESLEMLLFGLLEELVYYKDAEQLLLRVKKINVATGAEHYKLEAILSGEKINPEKHHLLVDVKAVTLHRFRVVKTDGAWKATVVVDI
ncbi:MAG: archease [Candidatus Latescibacter sp.]|nr:archease [Candidatus Latescibacter sp.]